MKSTTAARLVGGAAGVRADRVEFAGRVRTALVAEGSPAPGALVVLLHGGGTTARSMVVQCRARDLARRTGWRVVVPQGIDNLWRPTRLPTTTHRGHVDDVAFLDALLARFGAAGPTVVGGFSNGAMMAYRYGFERPDDVDLVLAVGGVPLELPDDGRGPAALHVHGTDDRRVPFGGGRELPAVDAQLRHLARRRGLRWSTRSTDPHLVRRAEPTGDNTGGWIELHVVAGVGHAWPGGVRLSPLSDDPTAHFDVGRLLATTVAGLARFGEGAR